MEINFKILKIKMDTSKQITKLDIRVYSNKFSIKNPSLWRKIYIFNMYPFQLEEPICFRILSIPERINMT